MATAPADTSKTDAERIEEAYQHGMASSYYIMASTDREPFLQRARDLSALTIPYLFRQVGANGSDRIIIPWNSIGAYCVGNLASKVNFALFPPGRPNFTAEQSKKAQMELLSLPPQEQARIKAIIRTGLSQMEQDVAKAVEQDGDRARKFIAALHLIVAGNHAFQFYPDGTLRGIPLTRYVVSRDAQGNLLKFCIEDILDWSTVPQDIKDHIRDMGLPEPAKTPRGKRPVKIHTYGELRAVVPFASPKWYVHQECMGKPVAGSQATYLSDRLPFMFLTWVRLDDEDYGRAYAESYEGDLLSAESFTKTIGEGSAAMARFFMLVSPTGMTDKRAIAKARNGDVIAGREQDVYIPTGQGKSADFSVASSEEEKALQRLARAFLLNTSIQRQGERVTAEEIRYAAQELEDALGGVYSQQVISWQYPYVKLKVRLLQNAKRIAPIPEGAVEITVTAGLAALARNQELSGLRTFAGIMSETFGAERLSEFMNPAEFSNRVAAALGVDPVGLVPTPEELAQKAQNDQMMMMAEKLGPEALRQVGQNVTSNQVADTNAQAKMAQAAAAQPPAQGL